MSGYLVCTCTMCHLDDVTRIKPVHTFLDSTCANHLRSTFFLQVGVMPFRMSMRVWHTMANAGDDTDGGTFDTSGLPSQPHMPHRTICVHSMLFPHITVRTLSTARTRSSGSCRNRPWLHCIKLPHVSRSACAGMNPYPHGNVVVAMRHMFPASLAVA